MPPRVKKLIKLINREESYDVEFKESLASLKAEDLVAFANSNSGGTILIGVKDTKTPDGRQVGVPVGCTISDEGKLNILNKAQSCRPPINIKIATHIINNVSIYKIDIPSSEYKPYCTDGGTYKTRGDGQKKSLSPNELLSLFMQNEKDKFITSFQDATKEMESKLVDTRNILKEETEKMLANLKSMETNIHSSLKDIFSSAENAESSADSIESTVDNIEGTVDDIWDMVAAVFYLLPKIEGEINTLLKNNGIEEVEINLKRYLKDMLRNSNSGFKYQCSNQSKKAILVGSQSRILSKIFPTVELETLKDCCEKMIDDLIQKK